MLTEMPLYFRWALFYEFRICHTAEEAYQTLYSIFGDEVLSMETIKKSFDKFQELGLNGSKLELIRSEQDMQQTLDKFAKECKINPRPVKDFTTMIDISTRSDDEILKLTKELTKKTDVIMTPLCYVIFPPGGYGYSFPVPTAFNPPEDRIKRLFSECKDLMKRFKRHGRRMSLHEILCDLYECDPKTTWLSDEELIMLPIWLPQIRPINRIVEDASSAIYTTFFQLFSSDSLLSWDDKTAKSYTEKFSSRINQKMVNKIETLARNFQPNKQELLGTDSTSLIKTEDVQRDLFLCGCYAFLEQFMSIMLCDLYQLKTHEVLPYYSKVWNILVNCLQKIINELNSNFSEDKMNKFSKILKVAIYWWKKIWFHNELMPRLIMQIIKDEMINFKDNSHFITSEVMYSYKLLKISTLELGDISAKPTMLQQHKFIQWHLSKYPIKIQRISGKNFFYENQVNKKFINDVILRKILDETILGIEFNEDRANLLEILERNK